MKEKQADLTGSIVTLKKDFYGYLQQERQVKVLWHGIWKRNSIEPSFEAILCYYPSLPIQFVVPISYISTKRITIALNECLVHKLAGMEPERLRNWFDHNQHKIDYSNLGMVCRSILMKLVTGENTVEYKKMHQFQKFCREEKLFN